MICGLVYTLRVATVEPFFTLYLPSEAFFAEQAEAARQHSHMHLKHLAGISAAQPAAVASTARLHWRY